MDMNDVGKLLLTVTKKMKKTASQILHPQTQLEKWLKEATSNTNWGCPTSILYEISRCSVDYHDYIVIQKCIWESLADKPNKWRRIYKTLVLIDYLIKNGVDRIVDEVRENIYRIRYLQEFYYTEEGKDKGGGIREKSKTIIGIINDPLLLKNEREKAKNNRNKYIGINGRSHINKSNLISNKVNNNTYTERYDPFEPSNISNNTVNFSTMNNKQDLNKLNKERINNTFNKSFNGNQINKFNKNSISTLGVRRSKIYNNESKPDEIIVIAAQKLANENKNISEGIEKDSDTEILKFNPISTNIPETIKFSDKSIDLNEDNSKYNTSDWGMFISAPFCSDSKNPFILDREVKEDKNLNNNDIIDLVDLNISSNKNRNDELYNSEVLNNEYKKFDINDLKMECLPQGFLL
ncbi:ENTH domain-containing protein [Cryptosporidium muris RN66]|uniref:ENTH domain-containing protein n=1 Tax=Cryptosporidium muris (strain RN66) TaxID=441375 RepID=B6AB30_CRYMR|nr:ENTH domain-containing protein [Cryptosporidium muris RN66]EEA05582.1 ENTH domain-containing protein [Cryptosporidium muris RN66]|eukprot:XP_002139931.1 ENTH domain-containing protein [Cryptosporidium muris RN66]